MPCRSPRKLQFTHSACIDLTRIRTKFWVFQAEYPGSGSNRAWSFSADNPQSCSCSPIAQRQTNQKPVKASLTRQGTRKGCADALKIQRFFPPCALHAGAQQTGRRCEESVGSHLIFAAEARYLTLNFYQMMAGKIDKARKRSSRQSLFARRGLERKRFAPWLSALWPLALLLWARLRSGGSRLAGQESSEWKSTTSS
jgi:hypothetical protein